MTKKLESQTKLKTEYINDDGGHFDNCELLKIINQKKKDEKRIRL